MLKISLSPSNLCVTSKFKMSEMIAFRLLIIITEIVKNYLKVYSLPYSRKEPRQMLNNFIVLVLLVGYFILLRV